MEVFYSMIQCQTICSKVFVPWEWTTMIRSTPSESNTTHVNRISFNVFFDMKVSKDEYHNFTVAKEAFCNSA